jgi:von Willebrand factor type A domain/Aerotolerance regulator N-terminal
MNLANPYALVWAGLLIPIVIFYILKIQLRRVPVSTILFWRRIFEEKQPRSLWQHLRHLLSLLLQFLMVLLLVAALAEPFFSWEVLEARRVVLVIDNSASMNATDVGPSRLAKARQEARRVAEGIRFRDEMAVVTAGTEPRVACGLTGHRSSLLAAVDAVPPTDGPTQVEEAVALARRLLADGPNGKVVVVSDGCFPKSEELAVADDVQFIAVGGHTGNVGITRFQVRRSLVDVKGFEVLAEVVNQSDEKVKCEFELSLNGSVLDVTPLELEPGKPWVQVSEKTTSEGGKLVARLMQAGADGKGKLLDDALAADNEAVALLPKHEPLPVLLVSDGDFFLERVLEANGDAIRLTITKELPQSVPPGTLVLFHRKVPEKLPPGSVFVIDPAASTDLWQLGDPIVNPVVARQDKDSPLLAHVRLDNVLLPEARKLTLAGKPQVLIAGASGEPLYASVERPEGKVLVLTVNLDKGDLPLRTAFPILTTNALAWFAPNRGELREALSAGSVTEVDLPSTAGGELKLWPPDGGPPRALPGDVRRASVGPLDRCGVWAVATVKPDDEHPAPLQIACNLASRAESDVRVPEGLADKGTAAAGGHGGRPLWVYLLAVACVLAGLEWSLYQRRWVR